MGKASRRRQIRRAKKLSALAVADPARFREEWSKRLESWARQSMSGNHASVKESSTAHSVASMQDLSRLAVNDLAGFSHEWSKWLEGWAGQTRRCLGRLENPDGGTTSGSSEVLRHAQEQLAACGLEAFQLETQFTNEFLSHEAASALARKVDGRSYQLTRTGRICEKAELYRAKRARLS